MHMLGVLHIVMSSRRTCTCGTPEVVPGVSTAAAAAARLQASRRGRRRCNLAAAAAAAAAMLAPHWEQQPHVLAHTPPHTATAAPTSFPQTTHARWHDHAS